MRRRWLAVGGALLGVAVALWLTRGVAERARQRLSEARPATETASKSAASTAALASGPKRGRSAPPPRLLSASERGTVQNDPRAADYDPRQLVRVGLKAEDVIAAEPRIEPWATRREARLKEGIAGDLSLVPGARLEGIDCHASSCVVTAVAPKDKMQETISALTLAPRGNSVSPRGGQLRDDGTATYQLLVMFRPELRDEKAYAAWYQKQRERVLALFRRTPEARAELHLPNVPLPEK
jgi:hypothetical protein